ncbi:MAG TPA: tetratricopeptide repeat protein [Pyrinomonadaceae bacterium]|jgi:Flp pilus assembly protein TadD|nr:tetratricopeptide repeat protein [Pyrinomonadaceae bacterium]
MRSILLICAVWLMILAIGCKRSGQQNTNNSAGTPEVSNGLAVDPVRARSLLDKGKELYRKDQDTEAVQALTEAVKLDPDLAEAHFRLALGYESLGKQEEAEKEYKKAVEAYKKYLLEHPDDAEAHYALGQTYAGLGQYSEAIREYREATKRKEDDPDMFYDLGVAHTKLAQYDAAAAAFSKSLEIDPDYYRAQDGLDEAKEGIKRIRAGRKHQEDLLKKQKEDELKKASASPSPAG